jgi:hypothetical protein
MKISDWRKSTEVLRYKEAWLSTVDVETDQDGMPITCIISVARYNEEGEIVTSVIEFNAYEVLQVSLGEWQIKTREYTNKVMAENRREINDG